MQTRLMPVLFAVAGVACALLAVILLWYKTTPQPYIEAALIMLAGTHMISLAVWLDRHPKPTEKPEEAPIVIDENDPYWTIARFAAKKCDTTWVDISIKHVTQKMKNDPAYCLATYKTACERTLGSNGCIASEFKHVQEAWEKIPVAKKNPGPESKPNGFSTLEVLVVISIAALIAGMAMWSAGSTDATRDKLDQAKETSRQALVESAWSTVGVDGPEGARLAMAEKLLYAQGIDPATVTDWTPAGLASRTPPVVPPAWLSPEALTLMGIPEP